MGIGAGEAANAIVAVSKRQKLSIELQVAALMALFKIATRASPAECSVLSTALQRLLQEKEQSRDMGLARLAAMTLRTLRCSLSARADCQRCCVICMVCVLYGEPLHSVCSVRMWS